MQVPDRHQLAIAKKTLKMSDEAVLILGGMTKNEAKKIINKWKRKKGK